MRWGRTALEALSAADTLLGKLQPLLSRSTTPAPLPCLCLPALQMMGG